MSIQVLRAGLLTTIQDLGRYGLQKYGVIVSGAMDQMALRVANLLVGNREDEAGLEITLKGPALLFEKDCVIAICGGSLEPRIDEHPIPEWRPVFIKEGSILRFGTAKYGSRAYLAVDGGFNAASVMGSKSTYLRAGIGGLQGRALRDGDRLEIGTSSLPSMLIRDQLWRTTKVMPFGAPHWFVNGGFLYDTEIFPQVRVIRGPQFNEFDGESQDRFFTGEFKVTPQSDRMGYRLAGPQLHLKKPQEMISEAVAVGTIQVPPDGNPILLLADRQTTGGYPKIANVISVDLPLLAQIKPGEMIRFREVTIEQAQAAYVQQERQFAILKRNLLLKS